MNTIPIIAFIIVVYFVQENFCDVADFFNGISNDIRSAFSKLWYDIKKTFTTKRISRRGRRKLTTSTTASPTSETTTEFPLETETVGSFRKVSIPVLPTPVWRGMNHWNLLQMPRYALTEGKTYELRKSLISKWADQYIGPRPTRVSLLHLTTSASPAHTNPADDDNRRRWIPVIPETAYIRVDNTYKPNDFYELVWN